MEKIILCNAGQIVTPLGKSAHKGQEMNQVSILANQAILIEDGIIFGTMSMVDLDSQSEKYSECHRIDLHGKCVLPGFVDSHTHFIFGGYRPQEFLDRLGGVPYLDILNAGGGIQSTVKSTHSTSSEELFRLGMERLDAMARQGVTTVEGKSGYGLDFDTEIRMLEVIRKLNHDHAMDVVPTYLGAHAIPPEYKGHADDYVDFMIKKVLPYVTKNHLAEFCDSFCEDSVFTVEQTARLFDAAEQLGLRLKIHADEIMHLGGSELAAERNAASADHLLMASDDSIQKLASSKTVATLLPCTAFCLAKPYAQARKMIDEGCAVALASDFNPGSCFTNSIPLMLSLAVIQMKMTLEEAITALTLNGAAAVGRADRIGSIEPGKQADLVVLKYPDYRFLVYHTGINIVDAVMKKGKFLLGGETI